MINKELKMTNQIAKTTKTFGKKAKKMVKKMIPTATTYKTITTGYQKDIIFRNDKGEMDGRFFKGAIYSV